MKEASVQQDINILLIFGNYLAASIFCLHSPLIPKGKPSLRVLFSKRADFPLGIKGELGELLNSYDFC